MTIEELYISEEEAIERLDAYISENFRTRAQAARFFQVSPQYISAVLKGRKRPNKPMLDILGLEKTSVRHVHYQVTGRSTQSGDLPSEGVEQQV